ncbi:MAG: YceI family protein [Gracilimonas sp.]|uniref:YceI family protein n=1 Tax=Gracilimonas sp. TaxID=1974203 RepID=UPI0019C7C54A|nr:YceI family protein [Gracilimonas sp.]MBD3616206.1 YceI family protein [Gracilimonas sp.]
MVTSLILLYSFCCFQLQPVINTNSVDTVYYSDSGYVEFTSSVPMHSFSGESDHLTGMIDFEENIIDFYIDLNTLKTGIGKRDRDMYQTLNTERHPFAEFTGSFESPRSIPDQRTEVTAIGEFTINGATNEVEVEGFIEPKEEGLILEAKWSLLISDYNIEPPGILFYRVDDTQDIKIKVVLKPTSGEALSAEN